MSQLLNMKKVLVTGGTKGIGLNLAKMFAAKNYQVVLTGTDGTNARTIAKQLDFSNKHIGHQLDLSDEASVNSLCENIKDETFDVVVHNTGIKSHLIENNQQCETFVKTALGSLFVTKSALPNMVKRNRGHIFFFCPEHKIDKDSKYLTPFMQTKLSHTTFMMCIAHMLNNTDITVAGFWTKYLLYTEDLNSSSFESNEKRTEYMDVSIISQMVEMMLEEKKSNIHGKVIYDYDYLTAKNVNLDKFKLNKGKTFDKILF